MYFFNLDELDWRNELKTDRPENETRHAVPWHKQAVEGTEYLGREVARLSRWRADSSSCLYPCRPLINRADETPDRRLSRKRLLYYLHCRRRDPENDPSPPTS